MRGIDNTSSKYTYSDIFSDFFFVSKCKSNFYNNSYHSQPNVRRECHQVGETSARVKDLYTEGGPEADESTNIFFVSVISNFFGGRDKI